MAVLEISAGLFGRLRAGYGMTFGIKIRKTATEAAGCGIGEKVGHFSVLDPGLDVLPKIHRKEFRVLRVEHGLVF